MTYSGSRGQESSASAQQELAIAHYLKGQIPEAERAFSRAVELARPLGTRAIEHLAVCLGFLGGIYQQTGRHDLAHATLSEALPILQRVLGPEADYTLIATLGLGASSKDLKRYEEAEYILVTLAGTIQNTRQPNLMLLRMACRILADLYSANQAWLEESKCYQWAAELSDVLEPHQPPVAALDRTLQARALRQLGQFSEATTILESAIPVLRASLDPLSPELSRSLNDLGMLYEQQLRLPEANQLLQEALAIRESIYGPHDARTAATLSNLGLAHSDLGQFQLAEQYFRRAHDAYLAAQGANSLGVCASLRHLGNIYRRANDLGQAEQCYSQALRIPLPGDYDSRLDRACTMRELAGLFLDLDDAGRAEPLIESALEIALTLLPPDHPEIFSYASLKGRLELLRGNLDTGRKFLDDALRSEMAARGKCSPNVARTYLLLGETYRRSGRLHDAEGFYWSAAEIYGNLGPAWCSDRIRAVSGLVHVQLDAGHYAEAGISLQKCHQLIRPAEKRSLAFLDYLAAEADYFSTLGNVKELVLNSALALEVSKDLYGESHRLHAIALENSANVQFRAGEVEGGVRSLLQAMQIRENNSEQFTGGYAADLLRLAQIHMWRSDLLSARSTLDRGLDLARSLPGPPLSVLAALEHAAAACSARLGLAPESETHANAALHVSEQCHGPMSLSFCDLLSDVALIRARNRDWQGAILLAQHSEDIVEHHLRRVFAWATDDQRLQFAGTIRLVSDRNLAILLGDGDVRSALQLVFRRKGMVTDQSAAPHSSEAFSDDPEAGPLVARYRSLLSRIAGSWMHRTAGDPDYQSTMIRADEERQEIEQKLARLTSRLRDSEQKPATVDRVANSLPQASVLIEFVRCGLFVGSGPELIGPDRYVAFLLQAGQSDRVDFVDLGEAGTIDALVGEFLLAVLPSSGSERLRTVLDSLYQAVIRPLDPFLPVRGSLILAPDSELNRLAFAALPDGRGGRIVDRFRIVHVLCGREVIGWGPARNLTGERLVLADPDFQAGAGTGSEEEPPTRREFTPSFSRLPHSKREGETVASLLGRDARLYTGTNAAKPVLQTLENVGLLHLASHGFVLPDPPSFEELFALGAPGRDNALLRSGVALAGAQAWKDGSLPRQAEVGIVTAFEIACMDLHHTELVVLSCCDSGTGEIRTGEGVYGLRRAFFSAGAKSLIISLWSIDDQEAVNFMQAFYRHLQAGKDKAEACQLAQLEVRDSSARPFYWSPFILVGDPAPLAL
jgi:CHAT domain-containing protein/Tfp pilus assembly protein PilF